MTHFEQLNHGWNADPNAPEPSVRSDTRDAVLVFRLNSFQFPAFNQQDLGVVRFSDCRRYRLGVTNDEGWYRGQCRFSKLAPAWGVFYEVRGDLRLNECPDDWTDLLADKYDCRHFLFYFRDETFECEASNWHFSVMRSGELS